MNQAIQTKNDFIKAAYMALNYTSEVPEWDEPSLFEVVETHEPVSHFRPVDVMTQKAAGEEVNTPYGVVVVRKNVMNHAEKKKMTMFLAARHDGVTLVGWDY
jgi:hypothetical protein